MLNAELDQAWLKGWDDAVKLVTQLAQQGERAIVSSDEEAA